MSPGWTLLAMPERGGLYSTLTSYQPTLRSPNMCLAFNARNSFDRKGA